MKIFPRHDSLRTAIASAFLWPTRTHESPAPRHCGVNQVPLQEEVMLHGQRHDYCREFRSLAFMDCDGVGQRQLVQFVEMVKYIPPLEANYRFALLGINAENLADVPVEHLLVVIVLGLDHLVSQPELPAEALDHRLVATPRVKAVLQKHIHGARPKVATVHGTEHLYVQDRIKPQLPRDAFFDQFQDRWLDAFQQRCTRLFSRHPRLFSPRCVWFPSPSLARIAHKQFSSRAAS